MDKFKALQALVASAENDASAFYEKSNKAAGTRLRKALLEIKSSVQEIRQEVTAIKNKA